MLETVADHKLWIWHAYFRVPGKNNDLSVLYGSPLFDDVIVARAPEASFVVNEKTYNKGYYFADGIYPTDEVFSTWMTFGGNTRDLGSFGEEADKMLGIMFS
ncbi:hypothetical protein Tco_0988009 [Tanacetum coccineum]|uniref:Protein ALP1-like n=1 Tax=Tanacetum coccineum TaxID=301880 RepID=A0ABQ5EPX7_9ASTR